MKAFRKSYYNVAWHEFAEKVKQRDHYCCLNCLRDANEVILQVHHKHYKPGCEPWDYPLSDCLTLCKGCHAREHGLIEPNSGWSLISIDDLGDLSGSCERKGCGATIRHAHNIYHPKWGYLSVGSTCIEYLTREDQYLSKEVVKVLEKISEFVRSSGWAPGTTNNGASFIYAKHAHNTIRIYGSENRYAYQLLFKEKGRKWHKFSSVFSLKDLTLDQVKEFAFIQLKIHTLGADDNTVYENIAKGLAKPATEKFMS